MNEYAGFPDLPVLDELGDRLGIAFVAAERRAGPGPRIAWRWRPLLVGALLFVVLAASAAAATLLALRGSVIPAPAKQDLQPPMIVDPSTVHLGGVTARDPAGTTTWTVRVARSETGLACVTAGELRDGKFGVTGLDGRFRELAAGFADGCGAPGPGRAAIIGARVFDSNRHAAVRTVVNGFGGSDLQSVGIRGAVGSRTVPVSKEGAFVAVFAGYPEDVGIVVTLRYASGRTEVHRFGASPSIAPDPAGALRVEGIRIATFNHTLCVQVSSARQVPPYSRAPAACGDTHTDYFFLARRMRRGQSRRPGLFSWQWHHAPRTLVYGHAHAVRQIVVSSPGRPDRRLKLDPGGNFQAVFPSSVDPAQLTLVVTKRDGTIERRRGSAGLVPAPRLGRHR